MHFVNSLLCLYFVNPLFVLHFYCKCDVLFTILEKGNCLTTFCKSAISFVFAAPALGIFHLMAAATEGNNFKTLAQELGQFEYSYLGEKLLKIPRGNNFPPVMQALF